MFIPGGQWRGCWCEIKLTMTKILEGHSSFGNNLCTCSLLGCFSVPPPSWISSLNIAVSLQKLSFWLLHICRILSLGIAFRSVWEYQIYLLVSVYISCHSPHTPEHINFQRTDMLTILFTSVSPVPGTLSVYSKCSINNCWLTNLQEHS